MSPCRAPPFAAARKNWLWLTAVFSDREAFLWIIQSDDVSTAGHYYRFDVYTRHFGARRRIGEKRF